MDRSSHAPGRRPVLAAGLSVALAALVALSTAQPSLAGCPPATSKPFPRPPAPKGLQVDPPLDTRDACPAWRWLGRPADPSQPCPEPDSVGGVGWRVTSLFGDGATVPDLLRSYCVYALETGGSPLDSATSLALDGRMQDLLDRGELLEVESTCAAVAPMGALRKGERSTGDPTTGDPTTGDPETWQALRTDFLSQAGALGRESRADGLDAPDEPALRRRSDRDKPVRLVLLDTEPTRLMEGNPPKLRNSPHGLALSRMVSELLYDGAADDAADGEVKCLRAGGDDTCPVRIHQRLALPIETFDWQDPSVSTINTELGGHFGTIDQLAKALWDEIDGWDPERESLVVNLSVAWVGEQYGGLEKKVSDMPLPVRSLFHALQVASCKDVLVLAAAGNRVGGPDIEDGPLLPGGWERREAPRRGAECREVLARSRESLPETRRTDALEKRVDEPRKRPLVYAVAGVAHGGRPLVNARPGSEPSRVAYGFHGTTLGTRKTADPAAAGSTVELPTILTGSSVATAVVAAAAAASWFHLPELSPHALMETIRPRAHLGRKSQMHLPGARRPVQQIDVCRAYEKALEAGGLSFTFNCSQARPVALPSIAGGRAVADFSALGKHQTGLELCEADTLTSGPTPSTVPCPFRQFYGIRSRPWTGPQPQTDPCIGCDIRPPPPARLAQDTTCATGQAHRRLRIQIDPEWSGGPLTHPTLQIGRTLYALESELTLNKGDLVHVDCIPRQLVLPPGGGRPQATLYFQTPDGSIESPVYISLDRAENGGAS